MNVSYPQPSVVEAPGGVLDPQNAINGATVLVTYVMQDSDLILLSWDGRGDLVTPKTGNSSGTVDFLVPRAAVIESAGSTIEVIYTVIRSGGIQPSITLNLTVAAMGAEVKPRILKVTGASGDVEDGGVTPDNVLTFFGAAGSGVTLDVFDNDYPVETVVAESDGSWRLTLSGLTEAGHSITAKTSGGQLVSDSWGFTVRLGSASGFEDFEAESIMLLQFGVPVTCRSGLILTLLTEGDDIFACQIRAVSSFPHADMGTKALQLNQANIIEMKLPGYAGYVTFDVTAVNGPGSKAFYFDPSGVRIGSMDIPFFVLTPGPVSFTAPQGQSIGSIQVQALSEGSMGFFIDHILWR
ncbi:hypothetical protein KDX30_25925 [Pseudomonas sp. CDFA 553]|uniref:hypothetical protein n=1 Tax=Pseudomonas quasicaspiana TaxID=2829821 RepID=UPI001E4E5F86|nr:hypothetical protein [Pseudomonas quasicaspiana]MCD5991323.1 hypothetical protein [Pseudomonas quasicaspiana]